MNVILQVSRYKVNINMEILYFIRSEGRGIKRHFLVGLIQKCKNSLSPLMFDKAYKMTVYLLNEEFLNV